MRPVPGERERLILGAVALFVLLAACYLGSIGIRATSRASITGDEPFYLITTQSLLDDGDLDLRQQYDRFSYRVFFDHNEPLWRQSGPMPDGRVLSPHAPGLSVFLLPGFALEGLLGLYGSLDRPAGSIDSIPLPRQTRTLPGSSMTSAVPASPPLMAASVV